MVVCVLEFWRGLHKAVSVGVSMSVSPTDLVGKMKSNKIYVF